MEKQTTIKRPKQIARGTVNHKSWLEFIEIHLHRDELGVLRFNGSELGETPRRALFRWRKEGATPAWYMADAFLCIGEMMWMDFEFWCELEDKPLWEKDPPENWD